MSGYWQVDVIVEGALDESIEISDEEFQPTIERIEREAKQDGHLTEVFTLWHDHPIVWEGEDDFEDTCIQYATDLRPAYVFGGGDDRHDEDWWEQRQASAEPF